MIYTLPSTNKFQFISTNKLKIEYPSNLKLWLIFQYKRVTFHVI